MPAHTEPWWVCTNCGTPIVRTGKGRGTNFFVRHREECLSPSGKMAGFWIKQVSQDELKARRPK